MIKLQNRFDREEFEINLQVANQRKVVVHTDKEDESICNRYAHKYLNSKDEGKFRTIHQMANSTELPGHDHANTMMLKAKHSLSEIFPHPI